MKKTSRTKSGKGIKTTVTKNGFLNGKLSSQVTFKSVTPYKTKNGDKKTFVKETTFMWVDSRKTTKKKNYTNSKKGY